MKHEHFRASIGVLVLSRQGEVLALRRADTSEAAWQLPQGGLHGGEDPLEAALRELAEETAIPAGSVELLAVAPEWLAYELPAQFRSRKTGRGQVQLWHLFRFVGADTEIQPDGREFSAWKWLPLTALLAEVVAFRRPVYRRLREFFASELGAGHPN